MYLSKLLLTNFRSYSKKLFEFDPQLNLIIGDNGTGKTNLLESIYFLISGKSFRSATSSQLVSWDQTFISVVGKFHRAKEELELESRVVKDPSLNNSHIQSRDFLINKIKKTRKKYLGTIKAVVFHPDDIRLVTGSPDRRRDILDNIFQTVEWRYASALSQYHRALKHRNELLDQISLGKSSKSELFYWDQSLIKNAEIIHNYRLTFARSANDFFINHLNPEIKSMSINYHPSFLTQQKLEVNYSTDLNRGYTQVGIHRDDFTFDSSIFPKEDKNLALWGSRGQQRLAVLALRLAQIDFLEKTYKEKPILLLDDIFSELDPKHQHLVVDLCGKYQIFFTSSEKTTPSLLPNAKIINL